MLELTVYPRDERGKKVKNVRRQKFIPGVLYGWGIVSKPVKVAYGDFERVFKEAGESSLVTLNVAADGTDATSKRGGEDTVVLIYEPTRDPVSSQFLHVDFYKVRLDQKIKINLPLEYVGESSAVRDLGGVLVKNLHEIEVEGYPHKLPKELIVDISKLATLDDDFFVKDLVRPEGIEILAEPEAVVATVVPPRSEAELAALEEAPEEKVEEVEVAGEKVEEEEEGEVAETGIPNSERIKK